jgi:release factor glutamine methyltransferase
LNPKDVKLNIYSTLSFCIEQLHDFVENPKNESEQIFQHHLNITNRIDLYINKNETISFHEWTNILSHIDRRKKGEPLQYILETAYFWNLPFYVNPDVLIPRPETELIVEYVLKNNYSANKVLDIGTGSGCIAIALKLERPSFLIDAIDICPQALKIAKINAEKHNVEIQFFQSDIFSNVRDKYDLIFSNPPYISQKDYDKLPFEIKHYEPKKALCGNENGLYFYEKIVEKALDFLTEKGVLIFEIGFSQSDMIKKLAKINGFKELHLLKDLNDYDRLLILNKRE